jgi:hypothetical protein
METKLQLAIPSLHTIMKILTNVKAKCKSLTLNCLLKSPCWGKMRRFVCLPDGELKIAEKFGLEPCLHGCQLLLLHLVLLSHPDKCARSLII